MFSSFRGRLIATVIALIAVTAGAVAILAYVLVRDSLRMQLIEDSVARAEFNITALASPEQLPAQAGRAEFEASGLVDRFLLRGTDGVRVEFPDGDTYSSSLGLLANNALLSPDLRQVVARGEFGYEFITLDSAATLVVGGRRPPSGPDFYFFYSAADVDSTLNSLSRVLALAGLGVLALGALGAGLIARRVLRPVATASDAAGVMAGGDLTVRLPATTNDELGTLALAFNQMALSLEEQIAALVEARERERRFVADVSHELRTPLTALVNEAALLEQELDALPAREERIGRMLVDDVTRMRVLVEDLLEVSRLASGPSAPQITDVDLPRFLSAVTADRLPSAILTAEGKIGSVRTDPRALERIVGNLLDNARLHAPGARVEVRVHRDADLVRIEVADDGPGVPPEALPQLFDRFYKVDSARQGGSGLGLAIARDHARHLGGDLVAYLAEEGGLRFELHLPVAEPLHPSDLVEKDRLDPEGEHTVQRTRRSP